MSELLVPDGFTPYGGAPVTAVHGADGALFWTCQGRFSRDPDDFGQYVFRQRHGAVERVNLPYTFGRGVLTVDHTGLYLGTWDNGTPRLFRIDQYVPFKDLAPGVVPLPSDASGRITEVETQMATVSRLYASLSQALGQVDERSKAASGAAGSALSAAQDAVRLAQNALANVPPVQVVSDQYILDVVYGKFKDFFHAALMRYLDHNRNDYDRTLRDWAFEKVKAWVFPSSLRVK